MRTVASSGTSYVVKRSLAYIEHFQAVVFFSRGEEFCWPTERGQQLFSQESGERLGSREEGGFWKMVGCYQPHGMLRN